MAPKYEIKLLNLVSVEIFSTHLFDVRKNNVNRVIMFGSFLDIREKSE